MKTLQKFNRTIIEALHEEVLDFVNELLDSMIYYYNVRDRSQKEKCHVEKVHFDLRHNDNPKDFKIYKVLNVWVEWIEPNPNKRCFHTFDLRKSNKKGFDRFLSDIIQDPSKQ